MFTINEDIAKLFTIFEEEKLEIKDQSYKDGLEAIGRLRSMGRLRPCRAHRNSISLVSDLPIKIERVTLILASPVEIGESPTLSHVCENLDSSYNIVFAGKKDIKVI